MKKILLALVILGLTSEAQAQGSGTPSTLRVLTDANGYLIVNSNSQTNPTTQSVFSNTRLKTDSNGYLQVVLIGSSATGVFTGDTQASCATVTYSFTGRATTGLNSHAVNTWNLCGGGTLGLSGNTTVVTSALNFKASALAGIGIDPDTNYALQVGGNNSLHDGLYISASLNPADGVGAAGLHSWPTINFTGTQPDVSSIKSTAAISGTGVASVTAAYNLWIQNPPTMGVSNLLSLFEGGGTSMFNIDNFMVGRNFAVSNQPTSQFISFGMDVTTDYDKTRAGDLIGVYLAPSLKMTSAVTNQYSLEIRSNVVADAARVLTNLYSQKILAARKDANSTVTNNFGLSIDSPTIGGTNNITFQTTGTGLITFDRVYTSATSFERLFINPSNATFSNAFSLLTTKGSGGGTIRDFYVGSVDGEIFLVSGNTSYYRVTGSGGAGAGAFLPNSTANTQNLGFTGNEFKGGYFLTLVSSPSYVGVGSGVAVANVGANSCGTSAASIVGNQISGVITVGATSGTQCRVTFTTAAPNTRECSVTDSTTTIATRATYVDTTHTDFFGAFVAGDAVTYVCMVR